jgi:hypothetical protein
MTLSEILNASKTYLYLTGKDAYIREYDICTHCKKSEFTKLISNRDNFSVHVGKSVAPKYDKIINRLGFVLKGHTNYNYDEYLLYYERLSVAGI